MPARDSKAAVVTLLDPPRAPAAREVKLPGKVPPVKVPPVNVRVNVVNVTEVPVPVTNLRDGFPITMRTSPTAMSPMLPITSLLTTASQPKGLIVLLILNFHERSQIIAKSFHNRAESDNCHRAARHAWLPPKQASTWLPKRIDGPPRMTFCSGTRSHLGCQVPAGRLAVVWASTCTPNW
jgi:hypothetical protein